MIGSLVTLLVICIIIGIIWWVADFLPVPEPLNKLIKVVSVVVGCIAVIYVLMGIAGIGTGLPSLR